MVIVVAVAPIAGTANGVDSQSRIIDRTLSCRVAGVGLPDPARFVAVAALPRRGQWSSHVYASHGSGPGGWSAGARTGPNPQQRTGVLYLNRTQCTATRARVLLSPRGLGGGPTRVGERRTCEVPARVLVRVRAVFRRPVTLRPDPVTPYQLHARSSRITETQLAIATTERRMIALASATAEGQASLFVARGRCFVQ